MKVLLKRDFIVPEYPRFKAGEPVEIPRFLALPRDAVVIDEEKPAKRGRPRKTKMPEVKDDGAEVD